MKIINISIENLSISAELNNTATAQQILESLPLEGAVNVWGEEIYFEIPLEIDLEGDATQFKAVSNGSKIRVSHSSD